MLSDNDSRSRLDMRSTPAESPVLRYPTRVYQTDQRRHTTRRATSDLDTKRRPQRRLWPPLHLALDKPALHISNGTDLVFLEGASGVLSLTTHDDKQLFAAKSTTSIKPS